MGVFFKLAAVGTVVLAVLVSLQLRQILQPNPVPHLEERYWGAGKQKPDDPAITPFKVNLKEEGLQDLQRRLQAARTLPPALEGVHFQYGFHADTLQKFVRYWLDKYDWRKREAYLNTLPQFRTQVQGLQLHYIHAKPQSAGGSKRPVPLLLLHGWPGSVREFYKLVPMLTKPSEDGLVFEVIAPSLPGYGFSEAAVRPGLSAAHIGVIFKNLMKKLGYDKFYVHGGDWGAIIGESMATIYPEHVMGLHSTMCVAETPTSMLKLFVGSLVPSLVVDAKHQHLVYPLKKKFAMLLEESGYMHLQATKPDTVGIALNDSPVGLAAYILEKFSTWTNPKHKQLQDGNLPKPYTYDDLLDNVMIYWISNSITTSMRLYAETLSSESMSSSTSKSLTITPTACARFQHELMYYPDTMLSEKFINLVQTNDFEEGGHFAAFELPQVVNKDLRSAVRKFMALTPPAK